MFRITRDPSSGSSIQLYALYRAPWWWIPCDPKHVGANADILTLQASACNTDTTPTQPHRNSNTHRTKNNTINVVIQQKSRKLLMMDILMSETCWAHKKWNKIASDIKLVFHSSTITMKHGPINIWLFCTAETCSCFRFTIKKCWPVPVAARSKA